MPHTYSGFKIFFSPEVLSLNRDRTIHPHGFSPLFGSNVILLSLSQPYLTSSPMMLKLDLISILKYGLAHSYSLSVHKKFLAIIVLKSIEPSFFSSFLISSSNQFSLLYTSVNHSSVPALAK
jgi:hypothetical protein